MNDPSQRVLVLRLRRRQTLAEEKLWRLLRRKAFHGFKFYRQFAIGPFVVDFCCRSLNLVIELDGSQHAENKEYDNERTQYLEHHGYTVIRFWNNELMKSPAGVLERIHETLKSCPRPSGRGWRAAAAT